MMENLIHRYLKRGMRIVLVNPTRVYGPGLLSVPNAATKIVKAYMEGKWRIIPGDGSRVGNYAFIDDIVIFWSLTPKWVKKYLHNWAVSSEKAQKELGYSITPLRKGLKKTVE